MSPIQGRLSPDYTASCHVYYCENQILKLNSVAFSPQANYTERPPLVGEVSANFCGQSVSRGQRNGSPGR
jgi:hypothetical protein